MGADPGLVTELQNHTGGLTTLVGIMGIIIGALLMGAYNYFQKRLGKVEDRQEYLRDKVLPQLITKDDLKEVVTTLKEVGTAFVERVEAFMGACHSGECSMALFIKAYLNSEALPGKPPRHSHIGKEVP